MYDRLQHRLGSKLTIIITAFFYALYHFVVVMPIFHVPVIATFMVFLAGIMWGIFRSKFHTKPFFVAYDKLYLNCESITQTIDKHEQIQKG